MVTRGIFQHIRMRKLSTGASIRPLGEHPQSGEEQEDAKPVENPLEPLHELHTQADHRAAHHQRPQDAPQQHAVLMDRAAP